MQPETDGMIQGKRIFCSNEEAQKLAEQKIAALKSSSVHTWMTRNKISIWSSDPRSDRSEQSRTGWCPILYVQLYKRI